MESLQELKGDEHLDTLKAMNCLGRVLGTEGNLTMAASVLEDTLEIQN